MDGERIEVDSRLVAQGFAWHYVKYSDDKGSQRPNGNPERSADACGRTDRPWRRGTGETGSGTAATTIDQDAQRGRRRALAERNGRGRGPFPNKGTLRACAHVRACGHANGACMAESRFATSHHVVISRGPGANLAVYAAVLVSRSRKRTMQGRGAGGIHLVGRRRKSCRTLPKSWRGYASAWRPWSAGWSGDDRIPTHAVGRAPTAVRLAGGPGETRGA